MIVIVIATLIIWFFDALAGLSSFWTYFATGPRWLVTIVISFGSGVYAPLDVFPKWVLEALYLTPFPYLVFFPAKIILGQVSAPDILRGMIIMAVWALFLGAVVHTVWKAGLKNYESVGR